MPTSQKDTEVTLGTGRMLALFFLFVLVCAVFFAIGFSLGRRTTMAVVGNSSASSAGGQMGGRPSAGKDVSKAPSQPADFSFYKAVGSSTANSELTTQGTQAQAPAANGTTPPPAAPAAAPPTAGGYFVQVAAVNRQEDADALVQALKKKEYPAFAAKNSTSDNYYHIQVGPYADLKDAEAMRARLIADGYNPIVKK